MSKRYPHMRFVGMQGRKVMSTRPKPGRQYADGRVPPKKQPLDFTTLFLVMITFVVAIVTLTVGGCT